MKRANSRGGWSVCARGVASMAAAFVVVGSCLGQAAPTPPVPLATEIDLGDFHLGDTIVSDLVPISGIQNVWFRFRLVDGITPDSWFTLDTSGSLNTDGTPMNTELGVFDNFAYLVAHDDYSGGGLSPTTSRSAALTFGGGSGERLGNDPGQWIGGRMDVGWNQKSDWQPTLRAGVYHVCIVGFDADFAQAFNPGWIVSTNFQGAGSVRLRLRGGRVPATTWSERYHGQDAGDSLETAQVVEGHGPLSTILAAFGSGLTDMFKIRICDPANFSVVATSTRDAGETGLNRLYLFDTSGRGVLGINGTTGTTTTLSVPAGTTLAAGDYYLAVASNCPGTGGFNANPYGDDGNAIWTFPNAATSNVSLPPNGTGAARPLAFFGKQDVCNGTNAFWVRLSLTGACHVEPSACVADTDDGSGTGTPDDAVTIDDLLYFLGRFQGGC